MPNLAYAELCRSAARAGTDLPVDELDLVNEIRAAGPEQLDDGRLQQEIACWDEHAQHSTARGWLGTCDMHRVVRCRGLL